MIKARWRVDIEPLNGFEDFIDQIDSNMEAVGVEVRNEIEPKLLAELQEIPGPVKYPIRWVPSKHAADTNKKPNTQWGYYSRQKAAFYATDGFESGIPTERTNSIVNAWTVTARTERGRFTLLVRNPKKGTRFVMGGIDFRSRNNALKYKQPFHEKTGWQDAVDHVRLWFDVGRVTYHEKITAELNRAVTSTRRNR